MIVADKQGEALVQSLISLAYKAKTETLDMVTDEIKKNFMVSSDLPNLLDRLKALENENTETKPGKGPKLSPKKDK